MTRDAKDTRSLVDREADELLHFRLDLSPVVQPRLAGSA